MSMFLKCNKQEVLIKLQQNQMRNDLPNFKPGDTVSVSYKITEGKKTRLQVFSGVCLKIKGKLNAKTFILRKESSGIGVEKTFQLHSPQIAKIAILKKGKVRRAYLSYMRKRSGKSARIEQIN